MNINYNWNVTNMERLKENDGVVIVHYEAVCTNGAEGVRNYGTLNFVPKPDDPNYTPFDQLTEEMVLSWVKAELDTAQIEQALAQKLNEKLNPTVVSGNLPWEGSTDEIDELA